MPLLKPSQFLVLFAAILGMLYILVQGSIWLIAPSKPIRSITKHIVEIPVDSSKDATKQFYYQQLEYGTVQRGFFPLIEYKRDSLGPHTIYQIDL